MKTFYNSVSRASPDYKNASLFLVKPLPGQKTKSNDYGLLQRAMTKQQQKKKKKKSNNFKQYQTITQNNKRQQWYSLDKLVVMNKQKNQQITRHIHQKAQMQGRNEELKMMMLNPTLREHELNQKIFKLQAEVNKLKKELEEKDMIQRENIQMLREQHEKEMREVRECYQKGQQNSSYSNNQRNYQMVQYKQSPKKQNQSTSYVQPSASNYIQTSTAQPYKPAQSQSTYVSSYRSINPQVTNNQSSAASITYQSSLSPRHEVKVQQKKKIQGKGQQNYFNLFTSKPTATKYIQNSSLKPRQVQQVRKYSPNQSKNTTSQSHLIKPQTTRYQTNVSPPKNTVQYRGNAQTYQQQYSNSTRPVSFAAEGNSVGTKQIDDIYQRYCLND